MSIFFVKHRLNLLLLLKLADGRIVVLMLRIHLYLDLLRLLLLLFLGLAILVELLLGLLVFGPNDIPLRDK